MQYCGVLIPSLAMKFTIPSLFFGAIICIVAFLSCGNLTGPSEFDFDQLMGRWVMIDGAKTQIETWTNDDFGYKGRGVVLNKTDTTFIEDLGIQKVEGNWVYMARVFGQNNNQAISFRLENQTEHLVAFANYTHDFPQRIVYEFVDKDYLQVYIEGPRDGEKIRIVMDFKRTDN
jgi:hypothetical protein